MRITVLKLVWCWIEGASTLVKSRLGKKTNHRNVEAHKKVREEFSIKMIIQYLAVKC